MSRDKTQRIKGKEICSDKGTQFLNIIQSYLREDLDKKKAADKMWPDSEDVYHKQGRLSFGISKSSLHTTKTRLNGMMSQTSHIGKKRCFLYVAEVENIGILHRILGIQFLR